MRVLRLFCACHWVPIGVVLRGLLHVDDGVWRVHMITWAGSSRGLEISYGAFSLGVGMGSPESVRKRRCLILSLVGCFLWDG